MGRETVCSEWEDCRQVDDEAYAKYVDQVAITLRLRLRIRNERSMRKIFVRWYRRTHLEQLQYPARRSDLTVEQDNAAIRRTVRHCAKDDTQHVTESAHISAVPSKDSTKVTRLEKILEECAMKAHHAINQLENVGLVQDGNLKAALEHVLRPEVTRGGPARPSERRTNPSIYLSAEALLQHEVLLRGRDAATGGIGVEMRAQWVDRTLLTQFGAALEAERRAMVAQQTICRAEQAEAARWRQQRAEEASLWREFEGRGQVATQSTQGLEISARRPVELDVGMIEEGAALRKEIQQSVGLWRDERCVEEQLAPRRQSVPQVGEMQQYEEELRALEIAAEGHEEEARKWKRCVQESESQVERLEMQCAQALHEASTCEAETSRRDMLCQALSLEVKESADQRAQKCSELESMAEMHEASIALWESEVAAHEAARRKAEANALKARRPQGKATHRAWQCLPSPNTLECARSELEVAKRIHQRSEQDVSVLRSQLEQSEEREKRESIACELTHSAWRSETRELEAELLQRLASCEEESEQAAKKEADNAARLEGDIRDHLQNVAQFARSLRQSESKNTRMKHAWLHCNERRVSVRTCATAFNGWRNALRRQSHWLSCEAVVRCLRRDTLRSAFFGWKRNLHQATKMEVHLKGMMSWCLNLWDTIGMQRQALICFRAWGDLLRRRKHVQRIGRVLLRKHMRAWKWFNARMQRCRENQLPSLVLMSLDDKWRNKLLQAAFQRWVGMCTLSLHARAIMVATGTSSSQKNGYVMQDTFRRWVSVVRRAHLQQRASAYAALLSRQQHKVWILQHWRRMARQQRRTSFQAAGLRNRCKIAFTRRVYNAWKLLRVNVLMRRKRSLEAERNILVEKSAEQLKSAELTHAQLQAAAQHHQECLVKKVLLLWSLQNTQLLRACFDDWRNALVEAARDAEKESVHEAYLRASRMLASIGGCDTKRAVFRAWSDRRRAEWRRSARDNIAQLEGEVADLQRALESNEHAQHGLSTARGDIARRHACYLMQRSQAGVLQVAMGVWKSVVSRAHQSRLRAQIHSLESNAREQEAQQLATSAALDRARMCLLNRMAPRSQESQSVLDRYLLSMALCRWKQARLATRLACAEVHSWRSLRWPLQVWGLRGVQILRAAFCAWRGALLTGRQCAERGNVAATRWTVVASRWEQWLRGYQHVEAMRGVLSAWRVFAHKSRHGSAMSVGNTVTYDGYQYKIGTHGFKALWSAFSAWRLVAQRSHRDYIADYCALLRDEVQHVKTRIARERGSDRSTRVSIGSLS